MKKIVPLKGYALITFENEGSFKIPSESLQNEKNGLVIEMGAFHEKTIVSTHGNVSGISYIDPGFGVGERIYFTQITGRPIVNENGSYAFINYSDVIGKELK